MVQTFKVFKYDSRNTGYYVAQDLKIKDARDIAIRLSKTKYPKATVQGIQNYFEDYENGEKTSWSA